MKLTGHRNNAPGLAFSGETWYNVLRHCTRADLHSTAGRNHAHPPEGTYLKDMVQCLAALQEFVIGVQTREKVEIFGN